VVVAVVVVALAAALALYLVAERSGPAGIPLAVLRAAAWGAVTLLLLDPGCRKSGDAARPIVLLDASLSMSDSGAPPASLARWRAALDTARALAGSRGHILLFGAGPAALRPGSRPDAPATRLLPAWREAAALGGRVTVVTDGEIDDARDLPPDFRGTRVVVLPRPARTDVGVAGFDLPLALRAGDTATAVTALAAVGTSPRDTAMVELLEGARVVARERVSVGAQGGGTMRRELRFVPAAPAAGADHEIRRYEARVRGVRADAEPRDDARALLADVTRASTIALFSDSPDWDFRTLAATLPSTSGVPVAAFVRVAAGPWRDAGTLRLAAQGAVRSAARDAALVVVHGTPQGAAEILALARHNLWRWTPERGPGAAGDWYVMPSDAASPLSSALAGLSPDSLPPLEAIGQPGADTGAWIGLAAELARRGRPRPVIVGAEAGGRRTVRVTGSGLWRWASKGGVALEGYRALTAAVTDWLLGASERRAPALAAARDSLARGLDELLPRPQTLRAQPGDPGVVTGATVPVRQGWWLYAAALGALMIEWIARRRRGMR
jgi:hypothetical protein